MLAMSVVAYATLFALLFPRPHPSSTRPTHLFPNPPLFRSFVLTTILIALLAGGLTYYFGLSMALGAFLAGMMLGESQYKYQLEADIRPFRDILMGLFFVTVGMQLGLTVRWDSLFGVVFGVFAFMIGKRTGERRVGEGGCCRWEI